ncbi:hypothetical protein G3A39_42290 [Paraburkholderia aspalathi]|nr:hypothetical protein [Paraburkholderia aspalathi]
MKDVWVFDIEVYRNYILIGYRNLRTRELWSIERVDGRLSKADRKMLRDFMRRNRTVGFNSNGFDLPILYGAIAGLDTSELKNITDDIIVGGMKPWDIEREYGFDIPRKLDHIDLIEVAPGSASLKIYNGRMHGRRMQDLPIEPHAILTEAEIEATYEYWKNDLDATELLFNGLKEQIDLRTAMGRQYGVDLRSKSDAQVGETVAALMVEKIRGERAKKPKLNLAMKFRYRAPDYIKFKHPGLNSILDQIEECTFRLAPSGKIAMPDFLSEARINVGTSTYKIGLGGLHSCDESATHMADDTHSLREIDVESYYPRLIINLGMFPESLGKAFRRVYISIVDRRLKAKAAAKALSIEIAELVKRMASANGPSPLMQEKLDGLQADWHRENVANEGGKIMINGIFGKLGSIYSVLFAPNLLLNVTLTGQLSMLMLIERLEAAGISVVSGNTDGIVVRCHHDDHDLMSKIVKKWQAETDFITDETIYSGLYSRDVNAYFAVKPDGSVKRKGAYAKSGLEEKVNPANDICADAVAEFLARGTPIAKTIRESRDIRQFLTVRTVNGGAIHGVKELEFERRGKRGQLLKPGTKFDASEAEYLGKAIRFYRSTSSDGAIHYKTNHNRVPKSDGCRPLMELPDTFPNDVDFASYIREARQILIDIGYEIDLVGKPVPRKRAVAA